MPTQAEVNTLRSKWALRADAFVAMEFDDEWERIQAAGMDLDAVDLASWSNTLWAIWQGTGGEASGLVHRELLGKKTVDELMLALDEAAAAIAQHAVSITTTTVNALSTTPLAEWEGLYDLWGGARSHLIGVSEVQQASAWAFHETARVMGTTFKAWRTQGDTSVRPTHQQAEFQQPIPLDQPFLVGGAHLRYPGDSSGPPEEVINCRCWETFIDI
jgi:hypothetical protein